MRRVCFDNLPGGMFQQFPAHFWGRIGYRKCIMADQKQNSEFLGGGPKFNVVGKDNRPLSGSEEPVAVPNRTGYWLRVSAIIVVVALLAGVLFYLNDRDLGKTSVTSGHGGQAVSPDAKDAPLPSNLQ